MLPSDSATGARRPWTQATGRGTLTPAERRVLEEEGILALESTWSAVARTKASYRTLIEESIDTRAAAELLGVSPARVRMLLRDRRLYGFKLHGRWRLPRWQFKGRAALPGLDVVLRALSPTLHPLAVTGFMRHAKPELRLGGREVSPLRWLEQGGDPREVVAPSS